MSSEGGIGNLHVGRHTSRWRGAGGFVSRPSGRTRPHSTHSNSEQKRKRLDGLLYDTDSHHVKTTSLWRLMAVASGNTEEGRIVRVAWTRDCEEEQDACMAMCMKSLKGRNWSHANKGSKKEHCRHSCRPAYLDCCELRERAEALKFTAADNAVLWLKQHHEELLVGTVVVITGVAFVVTVAGSGGAALLLVPAVLMVDSETPLVPQLAQVKP